MTLSAAGMFKEMLTVLAGTLVFGDRLAVANVWGVLVTLGGIGWYNWTKIQKMREENGTAKDGYEMVGTTGEEVEGEEVYFINKEGNQEHSPSQ